MIISSEVARELNFGTGKPGFEAIKTAAWLEIRNAASTVPLQFSSLDSGESSAIHLAWEISADFLLLDDRAGRREAAKLGVRLLGTIGVLQLAKARGFLSVIKPHLDAIVSKGFFISDGLYAQALRDAGE